MKQQTRTLLSQSLALAGVTDTTEMNKVMCDSESSVVEKLKQDDMMDGPGGTQRSPHRTCHGGATQVAGGATLVKT